MASAQRATQRQWQKGEQATRVPDGSIGIDGRLDEVAWRDVPVLTDFVQKEPIEGARPTDRMEVRFAYDDNALYVGARMYSAPPIQSPLGRRDEGDQAEHLLICSTRYLDRRTASTFGVTASGVRLDRYYAKTTTGRPIRVSIRCGKRDVHRWTGGTPSYGSRSRNCDSPIETRRCGD